MKKVICVLLLIAFCLCGCDIPSNSVFISPNKFTSPNKDIIDFEFVSENGSNAIFRDKVNDVLYYVFCYGTSGYGYFGITPIYGPDGKPIKYAHEAG